MIRLILFLALVTVISILISFIGDNDGSIVAYWIGYKLEMPVSTAIKLFSVSLLALVFVIVLITKFFGLFKSCSDRKLRKLEKKYEKGLEYVSDGLIGVISGDLKRADKNKKEASKYLKNSTIVKLLEGQIEQARKNYSLAARLFKSSKSKKDDELEFISEKLYLQNARKEHDLDEIIKHSEKALKSKYKNDYAVISLLKAYKEKRDLINVERIINLAVDKKIFDLKKDSYEVGMTYAILSKNYLDNKDYKKAVMYAKKANKILPNSVITSIVLARSLFASGSKYFIVCAIKHAWKKTPHPELYRIYIELYKNLSPKKRLEKIRKLVKSNKDNFESHFVLANAYYDAGLFVKAKDEAREAIDEKKAGSVYRLLAKIERAQNPGSQIASALDEKAEKIKNDSNWVCSSCGKTLDDWDISCKECKSFNSVEWNS
jgi:HemY protein